ncbi:unnamed protein product [Gadus morhua 'NCC']
MRHWVLAAVLILRSHHDHNNTLSVCLPDCGKFNFFWELALTLYTLHCRKTRRHITKISNWRGWNHTQDSHRQSNHEYRLGSLHTLWARYETAPDINACHILSSEIKDNDATMSSEATGQLLNRELTMTSSQPL